MTLFVSVSYTNCKQEKYLKNLIAHNLWGASWLAFIGKYYQDDKTRVARGLHCRDKKSVLWWKNTAEGDSLEAQGEGGDNIKMDPRKNTTFACGLDFSTFGLGPAAGCCEHGNKPCVLQNPLNHTFVSRSCFWICVSWVLNCHLITLYIRICTKKQCRTTRRQELLFLKVSVLPLTTLSLPAEHLLLQNFELPNCCRRLLKQVWQCRSHSVSWSFLVDLRI